MTADFTPPPPTATSLPAADVQATVAEGGAVVHQAFPVRRPESELNDFVVQVRASTLTRCRSRLLKVVRARFPWHEVMLSASSLAFGAFLGALPADLTAGTGQAIVFYTLMPVVGVGSAVAFFFLRHKSGSDTAQEANEALADLPDPAKAR
jgi:amino acid transporter